MSSHRHDHRSEVTKLSAALTNIIRGRRVRKMPEKPDTGRATRHTDKLLKERGPSRARRHHKRTAAKAPTRLRRVHVIVVLVLLGGLSSVVWLWWSYTQGDSEFRRLAEQGQPALSDVKTVASEGLAQHVPQGSRIDYKTEPPTTGAHYPTPSTPGYYDKPQLPGNLVHALEHGNIVIYYDLPSSEVLQRLERWANRYQDPWSGVIVTPMPGVGEQIILTAWTQELRLQKFDAPSAAAFIDRFRGHGPEHSMP